MANNGTFNSTSNGTILDNIFGGAPADVTAQAGIQLRAFLLNIAVRYVLLYPLKSRTCLEISSPETYALVAQRLHCSGNTDSDFSIV